MIRKEKTWKYGDPLTKDDEPYWDVYKKKFTNVSEKIISGPISFRTNDHTNIIPASEFEGILGDFKMEFYNRVGLKNVAKNY